MRVLISLLLANDEFVFLFKLLTVRFRTQLGQSFFFIASINFEVLNFLIFLAFEIFEVSNVLFTCLEFANSNVLFAKQANKTLV